MLISRFIRGSAIARLIGQNVKKYPDLFDEKVRVWVFQEQVDGRNLTDIINQEHENVKQVNPPDFLIFAAVLTVSF